MTETARGKSKETLSESVGTKADRKIEARREPKAIVYFGLGMFGLVGWSVAVPTLLGVALGIWIDRTWPSQFSWSLMLLVLGIALGCLNAWRWVEQASRNDAKRARPDGKGS